MVEYKFKGSLSTITYKRYNKKYTTPPIFSCYKFNIVLCLTGLATGLVFLLLKDVYQYLFFIDVSLALAYMVTTHIIKPMYQNGLINKSVYYHTKSYKFASFIAFNSQAALWRIIIPGIFLIVNQANMLDFVNMSIVIGCGLGIVSILSTFGIVSKTHFYTRTAQKAYNAIIEGPKSLNEDATSLLNGSLDFKIGELIHPELANHEFLEAQSKFYSSAAELKTMLENYDEEWRKSLVYGNYTDRRDIGSTPLAKRLKTLLNEHRDNANNLNSIINSLNEIEYVPHKYVPKVSVPNKSRVHNKPSNKPKTVNDFWGNVATWYN